MTNQLRCRRRLLGAGAALAAAALAAPIGGPAVAAEPFVNGRGQASASVVAVVPEVGSARLPVAFGLATAQFRARTGTAEASTLSLGIVGTILTLSICGGHPLATPDQLPSALHADSINGPDRRSRHTVESPLAHGGVEAVDVRPDAFAAADATPATLTLANLVHAVGTAHAEAELVPGEQRRAGARSEADVVEIAGGLVRLEGLRWEAGQATDDEGALSKAAGAFSLGRVVVGGVPLPVGDASALAAAIAAANTILEPLLMSIAVPTTAVDVDGTVTVTPLRIRLAGGAVTAAALRPLIGDGAGSQARRAVADALLFGGCQPGVPGTPLQQLGGGLNTVTDVVIASILGGGAVNIEIGGAKAGSDTTTVGSAFDAVTPPPAAPFAVAANPATPAPPVPVAAAPVSPAPPAAAPAPPSLVERVVTATRCTTTHPLGRPACTVGRGTLVVVLATAAALLLGAGDVVRHRRSRRAEEAEAEAT